MTKPRCADKRVYLTALMGLVLLAAGWFFWDQSRSRVETASQDRMMFPLPDKPSIAVQPFHIPTDGDTVLADGLTDDLITDLSKFLACLSSQAIRHLPTGRMK